MIKKTKICNWSRMTILGVTRQISWLGWLDCLDWLDWLDYVDQLDWHDKIDYILKNSKNWGYAF